MNFLKNAALASSLVLASFAAHADVFDFSYTFGDGTALTGSLSGTLSGTFVTGVSDVRVSLNGNEYSNEPLFAYAWNTTTHAFDTTLPAVVSTNASSNNFVFVDDTDPAFSNTTNYFSFVNDADPSVGGSQVFATNLNTGDIAFDNPATGTWSLVAAPVPEPETYAMVLAGLGLIGAIGRRRRQAQA